MQFVVSALGSAGDVHPFIAISQALQARGHRVQMIASPYFESRIRRAGIEFTPLGAAGDFESLLERAELWHPRRGGRFLLSELLKRLPEAFAVTAALCQPRDTVLVGSSLSWGLRLVQEHSGLPAATVHLSPICLPSATAPSVLPGVGDLSWLPPWALHALQSGVEQLFVDRWVAPRLNRVRAGLGLAPVQRVLSRWMHSPDLVIGAWPDWFAAPQPDWPAQTKTSGFPLFHESSHNDGGGLDLGLEAGLEAFLAAGPAPVGITPGSAMAHGAAFFAKAAAACAALGQRALLISPFREQLPAVLPAGALHVPYAPFSALLPRLSALVHHGGIGTSAQALAAGIPQLVVPFAHDQFDNAARLHRLGVAVRLRTQAPAAEWRAALQGLLEAPGRTAALRCNAERMRAEGSAAARIAEQLERLERLDGASRTPQQRCASDRLNSHRRLP